MFPGTDAHAVTTLMGGLRPDSRDRHAGGRVSAPKPLGTSVACTRPLHHDAWEALDRYAALKILATRLTSRGFTHSTAPNRPAPAARASTAVMLILASPSLAK